MSAGIKANMNKNHIFDKFYCLDLILAFDSVDYFILLDHVEKWVGIKGHCTRLAPMESSSTSGTF